MGFMIILFGLSDREKIRRIFLSYARNHIILISHLQFVLIKMYFHLKEYHLSFVPLLKTVLLFIYVFVIRGLCTSLAAYLKISYKSIAFVFLKFSCFYQIYLLFKKNNF